MVEGEMEEVPIKHLLILYAEEWNQQARKIKDQGVKG